MYEREYYAADFIMQTPDNKKISEMSWSELYWVDKNLDWFKQNIRDEIKKREEVLCDESRQKALDILMDKYLDKIQKGTGKSKNSKMEACDILLDIFFHKTNN